MKLFTLLTFLSFGLFFTAQAQEQSYVPNARQSVQKSRMQQPQYYEVTREMVNADQKQVESDTIEKPVNYQADRPVAIDAPKRRGKKSGETSSFIKLASYTKK